MIDSAVSEKLQYFYEFIERWKEGVAKEFALSGEFPIVAAFTFTRSNGIYTLPSWTTEHMALFSYDNYRALYPESLDGIADKNRFADTLLNILVLGRATSLAITAEAWRARVKPEEVQICSGEGLGDHPDREEVITITYEHELLDGVSACTARIVRVENDLPHLAAFWNEQNIKRTGRFAGLLERARQDPRWTSG